MPRNLTREAGSNQYFSDASIDKLRVCDLSWMDHTLLSVSDHNLFFDSNRLFVNLPDMNDRWSTRNFCVIACRGRSYSATRNVLLSTYLRNHIIEQSIVLDFFRINPLSIFLEKRVLISWTKVPFQAPGRDYKIPPDIGHTQFTKIYKPL